jgi:hypothetical protein
MCRLEGSRRACSGLDLAHDTSRNNPLRRHGVRAGREAPSRLGIENIHTHLAQCLWSRSCPIAWNLGGPRMQCGANRFLRAVRRVTRNECPADNRTPRTKPRNSGDVIEMLVIPRQSIGLRIRFGQDRLARHTLRTRPPCPDRPTRRPMDYWAAAHPQSERAPFDADLALK